MTIFPELQWEKYETLNFRRTSHGKVSENSNMTGFLTMKWNPQEKILSKLYLGPRVLLTETLGVPNVFLFFCISATPEKRALSSTNPTKLMLVNVTVNWQRLKEAGEFVINENNWRQSYFQQSFVESLLFSLVFLCSKTTRIWKFWEFLTIVQIDELLVLKTKSGC